MRRRTLVAGGVLTASLALLSLPNLAATASPLPSWSPEAAAFHLLQRGPGADAGAVPTTDAGLASATRVGDGTIFRDPVDGSDASATVGGRPVVTQPAPHGGFDWAPARYTVRGTATFYDAGLTAMRLPRGTIIRVCGAGGCLERVVDDYGPFGSGRVIDLDKPDFFAICGCASWSGTTEVTVYVY